MGASKYLVLPIASKESVGRALCRAYCAANGLPYPIPGVRVTGGIHGPGGETDSLVDAVEDATGTQCAVPSDAHPFIVTQLGKKLADGATQVQLPAADVVLDTAWFKAKAVEVAAAAEVLDV